VASRVFAHQARLRLEIIIQRKDDLARCDAEGRRAIGLPSVSLGPGVGAESTSLTRSDATRARSSAPARDDRFSAMIISPVAGSLKARSTRR